MNKQAKIIIFTGFYIFAVASFVSGFYPVGAVIAALTVSFLFFKQKTISYRFAVILLAIFLAGGINGHFKLKFDDDLSAYSNTDAEITATVISIPTNNIKGKTKFYADVKTIKPSDSPPKQIKAKTLVTLTDDDEKLKNIKIGNSVKLNGRIKSVNNAQNPYQFDYAKYLQYKNVFTLIYAEKDLSIISGNKIGITEKFLGKLNDKRNEIISIHGKNIKSPMLEVLGGIIFGDDAVNPDVETKKSFINSGIFHILAASGMNVTLIFGIWFFFAQKLRFNYKFSVITGMLLILFYTCMTGFGPPIIRAYLMLTFILAGKLYDRKTSTISLVFVVGLLMLLFNPLMLYDVGFQLSFIVTFALILTAPLINFKFKSKYINIAAGACIIPVIAQLYAFPLQMYYFNTFSLYSVFANIAIIPVLSLVSFIGFISSLIAAIPPVADKICCFADYILNPFLIYIVKTAEFFSRLPNAILTVQKPSVTQLILYYVLVIALTCMIKYKPVSKKFIYLFSGILLIFVSSFIHKIDNKPEILFFSTGNADAISIKTPDNKYFLTDTGKLPYLSSASQAKKIILPYYKNKGVKELEGLILSHFDADHAGGTSDILENIKVKNIYITDSYEDTKLYSDIKKYLTENDIPIKITDKNTTIYENGDSKITLLKAAGDNIKTENQKSVMTHFKYKDKTFLSAGDGDINSYNALDDDYKKNLTVMKSGHHGAKNTLNDEAVKNTETFIISTGYNIYGHPDKETLDIIDKYGKKYYRTDYHNAVKIIFDNDKTKIYVYIPKIRRFKLAEQK